MNINDAPGDAWRRNDTYNTRMPSPPYIPLPPPSGNVTDTITSQARSHPWHPSLQRYDWTAYSKAPDPFTWRYAERRCAQLILPYLYVGPLTSAKDTDFLRREGITIVIAVLAGTSQALGRALQAAANYGVEVKTVSMSTSDLLIPTFGRISAWIDQHITQTTEAGRGSAAPGKILIVCESGNDRSATVVAAHIIEGFHCDVIEAVNVVHQRRFSVNIDEDLRNKLLTYMEMVRARDMVAHHSKAITTTISHKRAFEDSDEEMAFEEDAQSERRVFSPFSGVT